MKTIHLALAVWLQAAQPPSDDERGLSQSTENAILLAGAVAIAMVIIRVITQYVTDNLPS